MAYDLDEVVTCADEFHMPNLLPLRVWVFSDADANVPERARDLHAHVVPRVHWETRRAARH